MKMKSETEYCLFMKLKSVSKITLLLPFDEVCPGFVPHEQEEPLQQGRDGQQRRPLDHPLPQQPPDGDAAQVRESEGLRPGATREHYSVKFPSFTSVAQYHRVIILLDRECLHN